MGSERLDLEAARTLASDLYETGYSRGSYGAKVGRLALLTLEALDQLDQARKWNERLKAVLVPHVDRPCEASEFYDIPEDGVSRCLDPECNQFYPGDPPLTLCIPCAARAALTEEVPNNEE